MRNLTSPDYHKIIFCQYALFCGYLSFKTGLSCHFSVIPEFWYSKMSGIPLLCKMV